MKVTEDRTHHYDWTNRDSARFYLDQGLNVHGYFYGKDASAEVTKYFQTKEEAQAYAANFPKSLRVRVSTLTGRGWVLNSVRITLRFQSNGNTGEKNETSIKRWASFKRNVEKLGEEVTWTFPYKNSVSFEEFDARVSV